VIFSGFAFRFWFEIRCRIRVRSHLSGFDAICFRRFILFVVAEKTTAEKNDTFGGEHYIDSWKIETSSTSKDTSSIRKET